MNCKNLAIKSKKGKKFPYCKLKKEQITFENCRHCTNKEYKIHKMHNYCANEGLKKKKCTVKPKTLCKIKGKKHKLTKATDIPSKVKQRVWERDKGRCVICGNTYNVMPNAHYVRRSKGGMGIEQNIFTACTDLTENKCHSNFDRFGIGKEKVITHFKKNYENWNEEDLKYKKKR